MGFWSWLFKKNKNKKYDVDDDDGQAQYFKSDFDEPVKEKKASKSASKKTEPENKEFKAELTPLKDVSAEEADESVKKKSEAKRSEIKKSEAKKPATEKAEDKKAEEKKPQAKKTVAKKSEPKEAEIKEPEAKKEIEQEKSPAPTDSETREKKTGRFEIKKAKDGRFVFNLYAPNHIIVATSQVYSSSSAAVNGIQSIITNAEKAPIEDNTLKNPTKQSYPKWEMYIDKGGEYRFRLYATNGNCVVHSQGYKQKSSCKNGIESIIRCSKNPEIDKSYLKKD